VFQLLDDSYGGKLTDLYLFADSYADPGQPGQTLQLVPRVDYDKDRFSGRFRIYVRRVSQMTPEQLKAHTPEQAYGFGSDVEKFEKINPRPFGEAGDFYPRAATIPPSWVAAQSSQVAPR
jgi:hypothetical protein